MDRKEQGKNNVRRHSKRKLGGEGGEGKRKHYARTSTTAGSDTDTASSRRRPAAGRKTPHPDQKKRSWRQNFQTFQYQQLFPGIDEIVDIEDRDSILVPDGGRVDSNSAGISVCTAPAHTIDWHAPIPCIPLHVEEALLPTLVFWGKTERNMLHKQPPFRVNDIRRESARYGVSLPTSCSLRRHHMQKLTPWAGPERLGLGKHTDIHRAAGVFEHVLHQALQLLGMDSSLMWTETELKKHNSCRLDNDGNQRKFPPTPDFLFKKPIRIRKKTSKNQSGKVYDEHIVFWMDAKMFYGASSIPSGGNTAVGQIDSTAEKYCRWYGSGVFVFMQGCGQELAQRLASKGCMVLDCTDSSSIDLSLVHEDMRGWCADKNGNILP